MSRVFSKLQSPRVLSAAAVLALPLLAGTVVLAQPKGKMDEIVITVHRVKALDKIDVGGGPADFFARATIGGTVVKSAVSKQNNDIKPDWKLSAVVPRGKTEVKLELLDKDVLNPSDLIDINRVDAKRHLDFTVNTANCSISGFSGGYSCGTKIVRAGQEKKMAEIEFRVSVNKNK